MIKRWMEKRYGVWFQHQTGYLAHTNIPEAVIRYRNNPKFTELSRRQGRKLYKEKKAPRTKV